MNPIPLANRQHGWVWAALPADCRHARVVGDETLAAMLGATGLQPDGTRTGPESTVVALGRAPTRDELTDVAKNLGNDDSVAVAWRGERRKISPVLRALRAAGVSGSAVPVGAVHVVVAAHNPAPSLLAEASAAAARAVGRELARRSVRVLSTGTVLAELAAPSGQRFALRVAGGPAGDLLERSADNLQALLGANPPNSVRGHVPRPLGQGAVGVARWTLEEWAHGRSPRSMSASVWDDCLDFLVGLHSVPGASGGSPWSLAPDFDAMEPHLDEDGRRTLARLQEELERSLADVPLGWLHGDFWPANLMVDGGRLSAVLDWDSATSQAPGMLDLMHLLLLSDRRARRHPHGTRSLKVLLPMARNCRDARVRRYCASTGTPCTRGSLVALALAYFVSRTGRDLRTFENRPGRREWMDANVHRPLRELADVTW